MHLYWLSILDGVVYHATLGGIVCVIGALVVLGINQERREPLPLLSPRVLLVVGSLLLLCSALTPTRGALLDASRTYQSLQK